MSRRIVLWPITRLGHGKDQLTAGQGRHRWKSWRWRLTRRTQAASDHAGIFFKAGIKSMKRFSCTLLAFGLFVSSAQAVVVFNDDFNSYADQAAFEASWEPVGCSLSGIPSSCTVTAPFPGNMLNSADFPERGNTLL